MRLLVAFLSGLVIFSCNSKNTVMTDSDFAKVYRDSLSKRYPSAVFELNTDLTITSKKGDLEFKHYIDNAYMAYQAHPDSVHSIISRYMDATTELYTSQKAITIDNIIAVIKPVEYLDEVKAMNKDGKSAAMITEQYNDQLIIAYAQDNKNNIAYLTEDDFKTLSISRDSLKSIALSNFSKILPNIQRQGGNGLYMLTAGGDYEASLILLSSIWTAENMPVDGDIIISIPNRDMLMITGSNNKAGISKMKGIAAESYKTGTYPISDRLYKWTGKKFILYE